MNPQHRTHHAGEETASERQAGAHATAAVEAPPPAPLVVPLLVMLLRVHLLLGIHWLLGVHRLLRIRLSVLLRRVRLRGVLLRGVLGVLRRRRILLRRVRLRRVCLGRVLRLGVRLRRRGCGGGRADGRVSEGQAEKEAGGVVCLRRKRQVSEREKTISRTTREACAPP